MKQHLYGILFLIVYVLWVVAFGMKLAGLTTISWWAIFAPIWIPFALFSGLIAIFFIVFILFFMGALMLEVFKK